MQKPWVGETCYHRGICSQGPWGPGDLGKLLLLRALKIKAAPSLSSENKVSMIPHPVSQETGRLLNKARVQTTRGNSAVTPQPHPGSEEPG